MHFTTPTRRQVLRIDLNYAACQVAHLMGFCALQAYLVPYLTAFGMSNTQIGLTTSLASALSIVLQLVLSSAMDKHPSFPIKRLIGILILCSMACMACLQGLAAAPLFITCSFALGYALSQCNGNYMSAQMMQFNNAGIPSHFGWTRGVGSLAYAVSAYLLGVLVTRHGVTLIIPYYLITAGALLLLQLLMPRPALTPSAAPVGKTSYRTMLSGNTPLLVFLGCILLYNIGNSSGYTFTMRVVERVGGGTGEYGTAEFVRTILELPILFASGFLLRHFRNRRLLTFAYCMNAVRIVLLATASSIGMVYFASGLNMFSTGVTIFATVLFANSIVREHEKVRGQSLTALCGSIGSIIGNAGAGALIDHIGLTAMLFISAAFCVVSGVLLRLFCKTDRAV